MDTVTRKVFYLLCENLWCEYEAVIEGVRAGAAQC